MNSDMLGNFNFFNPISLDSLKIKNGSWKISSYTGLQIQIHPNFEI